MTESFVKSRGRVFPKEDKIFGISKRAKEAIKTLGKDKVIDATLGVLTNDDGSFFVLPSVHEAFKNLEATEYASYASVSGINGYRESVLSAFFYEYTPKRKVDAVATAGGTGAIKNAVSNYTEFGDNVLVHDWYWPNYNQIAGELGRRMTTFKFFDEEGNFNLKDLKKKVNDIFEKQDSLLLILNTPAHNPTGYSLTDSDWEGVVKILNEREENIVLLLDSSYMDYAGSPKGVRSFLPIIEELKDNILIIVAYSMSKAFTLYGMRAGAMIAMSNSENVLKEFREANTYSSRASWSNSPRAPQEILVHIFNDEKLKDNIEKEREEIRNVLLERGKIFQEEAEKVGLKMLPYRGGFFVSIPLKGSDEVCEKLEKRGVFLVPLSKGIRVSISGISKEKIKMLPKCIKEVLDED